MKIFAAAGKWSLKDLDALIVPMGYKEEIPSGLPKFAEQLLQDAIERKEFSGDKPQIKHFVLPLVKGQSLRHVFVVGTGKEKELDMVALGKLLGQVIRSAQHAQVLRLGFWLRDMLVKTFPAAEHLAQVLGEHAIMAGYEFEEYRKKKASAIKTLQVFVENKKELPAVQRGLATASIIAPIINESRDLGNHPGNIATPKHLAQFMVDHAKKDPKLEVKVLGEGDMEKQGMGMILGVAKGSDQEAQFVVVEYWGTDKKIRPYIVIGKGVTFDSGGISIKPAPAMDEMKFDMCGAAAAFAIVRAVSALKLPVNLVCLVPAAENLIGPKAYKPGDILTAMDGTTVEIMNTDAEGRLLLGDALVYARQYKPQAVIDLATLTGAIVISLHDTAAGMFGKTPALQAELKATGEKSGDPVWPMPLPDEFAEHIRSKTADIMNLAGFRWGDAITGATFLNHFVANKFPWVHLDIAGVAWAVNGKKHLAPGATGAGVRVVVEWLREKSTQTKVEKAD